MNVASSPALSEATWQVKVAGQQLASVREQGQQALKLIESASAPLAGDTSSHIGSQLNLTA